MFNKVFEIIDRITDKIFNFFFEIFCPPTTFKAVPARSNWDGVPPKDLTWEQAEGKVFASIIPLTQPIIPDNCPVCGKELLKHRSDLRAEGYFVKGVYCDEGHWTYLTLL